MTLRRPSLATWAALALAVVAAVAVAAWAALDALDEWAPNVATEAASIAITVAIVERIFRRVERERLRPRVDRALGHLGLEFVRFVDVVALDYAATHGRTYRTLPHDALELLDQWLADQDEADMPRVPLPPDDETFLEQADEFVRQVDQYDHRDRDVLEPELVAAIRDVWGSKQLSEHWRGQARRLREQGIELPAALLPHVDGDRNAHRVIVSAARRFGEVLRRYAPPGVFEVDHETTRIWAEALRREQMEHHGLAESETSG